MRLRLGWPSKAMPNISHASRSYQLAEGHKPTMLGRERRSSRRGTFHPDVRVAPVGEEMVDHRKVALGLARPVDADPLVDGGQVVKHAKRLGTSFFRQASTPGSRSRDTQTVGTPSRVACSSIDPCAEAVLQLFDHGSRLPSLHASRSVAGRPPHKKEQACRRVDFTASYPVRRVEQRRLPAAGALDLPHGRHLRPARLLADPPPN